MLATLRNRAGQRQRVLRPRGWSEVAILSPPGAGEGDREWRFGELVEQFERTVHAICLRRLGNPSEAIELTQEVFLHVMRRIGQLREPERFAGWLRQVAVRMAINRKLHAAGRPHERRDRRPRGPAASGATTRSTALITSRERAKHPLGGARARLKALDREALLAFYIQGQSLIEIADQLDAPIGTVWAGGCTRRASGSRPS